MLPDNAAESYHVTEMSAEQLLAGSPQASIHPPSDHVLPGLNNEAEGAQHYLTMPASRMGGDLLDILPQWQALAVDERAGRPGLQPYVSVWMGGAGVATQAHYDVANNLFVQLEGTKRFRCWGPGAHCALHVYPDAHPRARKAQLDVDAINLARFPIADELGPPLEFVLEPGDALYIPPFWCVIE